MPPPRLSEVLLAKVELTMFAVPAATCTPSPLSFALLLLKVLLTILRSPPVPLNRPPPSDPTAEQLLPEIVLFVILTVPELLLKIPAPHPAVLAAMLFVI